LRTPETDESGNLSTFADGGPPRRPTTELIPGRPEKIPPHWSETLEKSREIIVNGGTGITARGPAPPKS